MDDELLIRVADATDLPVLGQMLDEAGLPVDDLTDPTILLLVIDRDGQRLACAGLQTLTGAALLRSLCVLPAARRLGLGAILVNSLLGRVTADGKALPLYLLTNDADGYFVRHGFEVVSRDSAPPSIQSSRQFSQLCPDSAILMKFVA